MVASAENEYSVEGIDPFAIHSTPARLSCTLSSLFARHLDPIRQLAKQHSYDTTESR